MTVRQLAVADCWNQIGVQGDRSCPELAAHTHCRNCPVYAAAARASLDRELPDGYGQSWAQRFRDRAPEANGRRQSLLVFRIGAEWLALPTAVIDEVANVPAIHVLPHRRGGTVLGIVNVRGELLLCVSLGHVLGAELGGADREDCTRSRGRLLVLRRGGSRFATPVDEVDGTRRVDEEELVPTPATLAKGSGAFSSNVLALPDRSVGCLDDEFLFNVLERSCT